MKSPINLLSADSNKSRLVDEAGRFEVMVTPSPGGCLKFPSSNRLQQTRTGTFQPLDDIGERLGKSKEDKILRKNNSNAIFVVVDCFFTARIPMVSA